MLKASLKEKKDLQKSILYQFLQDKLIQQKSINLSQLQVSIIAILPSMNVLKEDESNLYRVLERGDRSIEKAFKKAVMLVGLTRAGKSTTFNWLLGKQMIGVGDQIEAHYQNVINDADSAKLGDTFTSVTLCPNIRVLDAENQIALMDMAGYKDKRDYIGVLGVSYFLKAVFERIQEVKFLIVLDEHKLIEKSGDGIIATLNGFINMFKITLLTPELRKRFYASISVLVTRSEKVGTHQLYLKRIKNQIGDKNFNVQNRNELLELMDNIINDNRLEAFPIAIANKNPPKCDFLDRFGKMGWEYFNIKTVEEQIQKDFISLPFIRDYEDLNEKQKTSFSNCIQARVDSYVAFSKIINTLIHSVKESWDIALQQFQNTGKLELNLGRCRPLFVKVEEFLQVNDCYNSQELVFPQIKTEYKVLNFVGTINQILKIYAFIDRISETESHPFIENMQFYSQLFGDLILSLVAFASSQAEQHLLLRLRFIIKRGLREFSKLYQLKTEIIHDVNQKMKDNCNNDIFEETRGEFIERFITKIDQNLLQVLFTKIQDLLEYEAFFKKYEEDFRTRQDPIFFSEHRYNLESAKARLGLDTLNKKEAIRNLMAAYKNIDDMAQGVRRNEENQEIVEEKLNDFHMKKLNIIGKINNLLKNYKEVPSARNYALTFSKYIRDIYQACEIYEIIIADSPLDAKMEHLQQFADFCLEWGRFEQANKILQRKLSLERSCFANYNKTIKKLSTVTMDRARYLERYNENLSNWPRLPEIDPTMNNYLEELELILRDP